MFSDREFFMRSHGQVRFIKISARLQMIAAGAVAALLGAWLVTMAAMALASFSATRDRIALLDREARVTSAESRVSSYRHGVEGVASDLARRQDFIEKMVEAHVGDLPADAKPGETVSNSAAAAADTVHKVGLAVPGAAGLARLEMRQLAFVEKLTRLADRRAAQAAGAMRRLGLDPASLTSA